MIKSNHKELNFFKKAHELTVEIYKITKDFPKEETYGLSSQLRRASVSIGSNISEGSGRNTLKDYKHFLHNALGSAKEVEYQLLIAKDLDYFSSRTYDRLIEMMNIIIGSMTNYMKKINV